MSRCKFFLIVIVLISLTSLGYFSFLNQNPVSTEEQAILIAEKYVSKKYNNNFNKYAIMAELEDDTWIVTYYKNIKLNEGEGLMGGGGPELHIKKSNGKVIRCLLQK